MYGDPHEPPHAFTLRDGAAVLLRPIRPQDKQALREGLAHLSPESRYRRFLGAVSDLPERHLRYLTEVDYDAHMAWIAFDAAAPGRPGLGVARYVKLPDRPGAAEWAVAVVDSHQGRGLGTLLLAALARSAAEHGVDTLVGYVDAGNAPMLKILEGLGAGLHPEEEGVLRAEWPVPREPADLPDTPTGRVFQEVARRLRESWPG